MIKVENLVKSYGKHKVLQGLNLDINTDTGLIYGFLGKNGSGKTTTMNILTGLARYDSGKCVVNGVTLDSKKKTFINSIGYLPESPGLYEYMTAYEYLHFLCKLFMDNDSAKKRASELLELSGLTLSRNRKVGGFSRGMKQRLGIVGTLAHDPKLIFLDEPTSALDPEGRYQVLELLEKLKSQGKVVFLSTHLLDDVERVCDRVGILDQGKLIIEGSIKELLNNQVGYVFDIEIAETTDYVKIKEEFDNNSLIKHVQIKNNLLQVAFDREEHNKEALNYLLKNKYTITSFSRHKIRLEDIFLSIYRGE